jgi:small-conductance mechanosensitive channel
MTAKEHNNLLGIFILVQGGLTVFAGLLMLLIYGGMGAFLMGAGPDAEAKFAGGLILVIGLVVAVVVVLFSALYFYTGIKIRKEQSIGRTLGIIVSVLSLFSFPLGTALGVYGLWFFLGDLGKGLYLGTAANGNPFTQVPPPPNSWQ